MPLSGFSSLRVRLMVLVILAALPVLALILYNTVDQRSADIDQSQEETQRLNRLAVSTQEEWLEGARQLLISHSHIPAVRNRDAVACNEFFASVLKDYPFYANLFAAVPNGDIFCSVIPLKQPVNIADRAWFQRAVSSRDFSIGDYQAAGRITDIPVVVAAFPVYDNGGQLLAVVGISLDLDRLNELAAQTQLPQNAAFIVFDRKGTILTHYPDPEKWTGQSLPEADIIKTALSRNEGTAIMTGVDGIARIQAFAPINSGSRETGIYGSIGVPLSTVYAEANRALVINLSGLGIVIFLLLLIAWFGSDAFIVRHMKALMSAAKRLGAGDLRARTGMPYGKGELGELARVFDVMAQSLEERGAERQRAEENTARYREIFENSLNEIYMFDAETLQFIEVNGAAQRNLGYSMPELEQMTPLDLKPALTPETFADLVTPLKTGDKEKIVFYTDHKRKDGSLYPVEVHLQCFIFESHRVFVAIILDITERKLAERALQESETKLRAIFQESRDAIGVSKAGTHVLVNTAYLKLFGYEDESELFGTSILSLIAPDEREKVQENGRMLMEVGEAPQFYETRGLRKDGSEFDMDVSVSTYELEGEVYTLVTLRDITEHKILEESLRQSQKMEGVGRLAGGVAHDFNNFLTAVEGYIDLTLLDLPDGSHERENLLEARHSAERAADLTRQLLLFSRREPLEPKPVNLNAIINELLKMLSRLIGEQYSIITSLDDDLPTVKADTGHIEQVLMNLVVNARDAMGGGGEIEIGTAKVQVDEEYVYSHTGARTGKFARLFVRDTGSGMDADTLSHVFEPFFSTKKTGMGTGLGLSVVYGIIAQHGGWIDVESKPGSGSTFSVFLPAVPFEVAETGVETVLIDALQGHGEKILLVEDEESVRALAEKMLSGHNYTVVSAASAEEALDIFEKESGDFRLVFSDVILPGMDGIRLVGRLIECKPELRVMLASGFMEGMDFQKIRRKGYRFLEKPYALTDLLQQVKELLEEATL